MPDNDGPVASRSRAALRLGYIFSASNTDNATHHFLHSLEKKSQGQQEPHTQIIRARHEKNSIWKHAKRLSFTCRSNHYQG